MPAPRTAGTALARSGVAVDIGEGPRWLAHRPFLRVLTAVTAVLGAALCRLRGMATVTSRVTALMTTIGLVGSGNIGAAVARLAVRSGYQLVV